jgi:hypothetical protein
VVVAVQLPKEVHTTAVLVVLVDLEQEQHYL